MRERGAMSDFGGFGTETLRFLRDLTKDNSKAWFDENRPRYEAHYLEPAKDFICALEEPLRELWPKLHVEPRVNGSIFRINRDVRFSKDKTPYKNHLDLWFWEGERKTALSGLFFRLTGDQLYIGAGAHHFSREVLPSYRNAVVNPRQGAALLKVEKQLKDAGLTLDGEHYVKLPRGFDAQGSEIDRLLKFNSLIACHVIDHPPSLGAPQFLDYCLDKWRQVLPVHKWLVSMDAI